MSQHNGDAVGCCFSLAFPVDQVEVDGATVGVFRTFSLFDFVDLLVLLLHLWFGAAGAFQVLLILK